MMAKATDKQKKHVVHKKNQPRTKKRNNEEVDENNPNIMNDTKKKAREDIIEESFDNSKSKTNDNDDNYSDDDKNMKDHEEDNIEQKSSNEDADTTDDEKSVEEDNLEKNEEIQKNKIVPMLQVRSSLINNNTSIPEASSTVLEEETGPRTVEETVLYTDTYCETLPGFNSVGKKNMLSELTAQEIIVLRGYVRKDVFRMIKFLSDDKLRMNSTIMNQLYEQISVTDDKEKIRKHVGVRYLLQRQLNSKRNYCTEKIVKQMKGIFFN
jgi:hypothetical protein